MVKCKCGKNAIFGYFEEKIPRSCKNCKDDFMINIQHIKDLCSCKTRACFGFPKDKKASCCNKCKKEGMVNIVDRKCKCGKTYPIYGMPGDKKANYCKLCKTDGMVNVRSKRCQCGKSHPNFGFPNKKQLCCNECKKKGMVSLKGIRCKCGKYPSFGFPNQKIIKCNDCKEEGMIALKGKFCKCGKRPTFGLTSDTSASCCKDCKTEEMVDIYNKHKICKSNSITKCTQRGNKKYDGYCTFCFSNMFPEDPRTQFIFKKSKELKVVSYIKQIYPIFIHDKPFYVDLKGGCCNTKRRIDLRVLVNNTMLCIEIDENQHKWNNQQDEVNRYDNLFMDFSGKYVFIRYNPDKFKIGKTWKNPRFETRMEKLIEEIDKQINRIQNEKNTELVEIHKLYFCT